DVYKRQKLAGVTKEQILSSAKTLLDDKSEYDKMAKAVNPYGDGYASRRITQAILYYFKKAEAIPEEFLPK
ncbi:MAG: UDP-N-acetylglucosamine 2-epimerase, partial [Clostridiales bacterium]|nr:UDP-N-acetylglucosamine 2-epimerase [Clostridiales bacterium]